MEWNPNKPKVIGPEFPPRTGNPAPERQIDAPYRVAAQRLDSTVTETITAAAAVVDSITNNGIVLAEILLAGSEDPGAVTTTTFRPTEVTLVDDLADQDGNTTAADILAVISRSTPSPSEYITGLGSLGTGVGMQFDLVGQLTGRRIVDVRVVMVGGDNGGDPADGSDSELVVYMEDIVGGGAAFFRSDYFANTSLFTGTSVTELASMGEMYPPSTVAEDGGQYTEPWTVAQLLTLDDAAARHLLVSWALDSGGRRVRLYTVHLEVDHVAENRVARTTVRTTAAGPRLLTWTPHKPTDGSNNFAKVNGTDLTVVLRRPYYGVLNGYLAVPGSRVLSPSAAAADYSWGVPYLDALTDDAPTGLEYYDAAANANGTIAVLGDPVTNRVMAAVLSVAGPTQSVDSQPYATIVTVPITGTVQQEISGATAQNYHGVLVPLRLTLDGGLVGDLTVELRRRSDSNLMATATITQALAASFDADAVAGWRRVQAPFAAPATLAAAVQYYLAFSAAGVGSWEVPALSGNTDGSDFTGLGSYVGTTDVATYGGGDVSNADIPALVYVANPVVSSFTATAGSDAQAETPAAPDAAITAVGKVVLDFDPTGDDDLVIEIQRSDAFTDWATIAMITDANVGSFTDYEARQNQESCYQARTVSLSTGLVSAWTATVCATRESFGCGYTFTSNEYPDLNVAYSDIHGEAAAIRDYEFPEAAGRVFRPVYGRDYQIGFRPLERRGMSFTRRLLIDAFTTRALPGPTALDTLRDLAAAVTSYVAVTDEDGNRWLAAVDVPTGQVRRPGELVYADVTITEVTDTPSQADVVASGA